LERDAPLYPTLQNRLVSLLYPKTGIILTGCETQAR
jgi:hypothetical protein